MIYTRWLQRFMQADGHLTISCGRESILQHYQYFQKLAIIHKIPNLTDRENKKLDQISDPVFYYLSVLYYLNWKMIGNVYLTRTGLFLCLPGVHFGELDTTLTASLSKEESTPLRTVTFDTLPSVSIVN